MVNYSARAMVSVREGHKHVSFRVNRDQPFEIVASGRPGRPMGNINFGKLDCLNFKLSKCCDTI